jgi:hypothetical protein
MVSISVRISVEFGNVCLIAQAIIFFTLASSLTDRTAKSSRYFYLVIHSTSLDNHRYSIPSRQQAPCQPFYSGKNHKNLSKNAFTSINLAKKCQFSRQRVKKTVQFAMDFTMV